jgi:hypothetical protein
MDEELLEEAKVNPDLARKILLFHATQGRIFSNTIKHNQVKFPLRDQL